MNDGEYIGSTELSDLHGTDARTREVEEIIRAIDESYVAESEENRPTRLRPSSVGIECSRQITYDFWWASDLKKFEGRMLRLFGTGHRIEDDMVLDLKRGGMEVLNRDPTNPKKQLSITALNGHMFGYLDAIVRDRVGGGGWMVCEIKSHNKNSYAKLLRGGCEATKPEHHAQLQIYMHFSGIERGVYFARCKDDDAIYLERIDLNEKFIERLLARAVAVLDRKVLPPKINNNPKSFKCRFCSHIAVCHGGVAVARNCRTCEHIVASEGGKFGCKLHACEVTKELALASCENYVVAEVFR